MLTALTCNLPGIVAALRSPYFRNLGVCVTVVTTADELLQCAAVLQPDLVIVLAGTGGVRTGFIKALRSCLNSSRTMVLHAVSCEHGFVDEDLTAYDGIVSLEEPELELARLLSERAIPPRRKRTRTLVRLPVRIDDGTGAIDGVALDLNGKGAGVLAPRMPENAGPYELVFRREDGRCVPMRGRAVWADARIEPTVRLGLRFIDVAPEAVRGLLDLAFWTVETSGDGEAIHLHGELSEATDFAGVRARIADTPVLDLRDLVRINSAGTLQWTDFIRGAGVELRLRRVSAALMRQIDLIPSMAEHCVIESFYSHYDCDVCDQEFERLVTPNSAPVAAQSCPFCGVCTSPPTNDSICDESAPTARRQVAS